MYNTLFTAFTDTLNREGRIVNDYATNLPYTVIFRRNNDKNSFKNRTTIYYPTTADIKPGQLLCYADDTYIVINKETAENGVYYRSDLLKTNATIIKFDGPTEYSVPVYAGDVNSAFLNSGEVISVVDGNVEMITTDNDYTSKFKIDDGYYAIGNYWKLNNIFHKDGVLYLYSTVDVYPADSALTLTIQADESYKMGSTATLKADAKYGDTIISNARIAWSVDDPAVAAIGSDGTLTCIAQGSVIVTATWVSQNISATKTITVDTPDNYALTITADDTYTTADTPTITATAQKNGTTDTTATITWESSDPAVATIDGTGKVTFLAAGSVTFTAIWTEQSISATKTITVEEGASGTCNIAHNNGTLYEPKSVCSLKVGGSPMPFNAVFKDANGNVLTELTPSWTLTNLSGITADDIVVTYDTANYPLRVYLNIVDQEELVGATFTLHLVDSTNTLTPCDLNCKVDSFW